MAAQVIPLSLQPLDPTLHIVERHPVLLLVGLIFLGAARRLDGRGICCAIDALLDVVEQGVLLLFKRLELLPQLLLDRVLV